MQTPAVRALAMDEKITPEWSNTEVARTALKAAIIAAAAKIGEEATKALLALLAA